MSERNFRIVMTGPHGEHDYVEKILDLGVPCICGDEIEYAGIFPEACAKVLVEDIKRDWLFPHVAVDLEPVETVDLETKKEGV
jgi:hypothetical protein